MACLAQNPTVPHLDVLGGGERSRQTRPPVPLRRLRCQSHPFAHSMSSVLAASGKSWFFRGLHWKRSLLEIEGFRLLVNPVT